MVPAERTCTMTILFILDNQPLVRRYAHEIRSEISLFLELRYRRRLHSPKFYNRVMFGVGLYVGVRRITSHIAEGNSNVSIHIMFTVESSDTNLAISSRHLKETTQHVFIHPSRPDNLARPGLRQPPQRSFRARSANASRSRRQRIRR